MSLSIRAAVLDAVGQPFRLETLELSAPRRDEVRVRVAATGICRSDHHLVTGATTHPLPVVCGHEGAGVVEEVGSDVDDLGVGDHVVLNWAPACRSCFHCDADRPHLCDTWTGPIWSGTLLDGTTRFTRPGGDPVYHYCGLGAFAEQVVVPRASCVEVARDVPLETVALVGCAVATGVGAVAKTSSVAAGESVVVLGTGGVGLNVLQAACRAGAHPIIACDMRPEKEELARAFGATDFVVAENIDDVVKDRTEGHGADHVFEAVGSPALQERSLDWVRPGGTITLVGLSSMTESTNLSGAVIARREITIRGSYYGSVDAARDFPLFVDLYRQGELKLDELVTHRYRPDEINEAFAAMMSGKVGRGVIVW